jgi:hypothetical protein
VSNRRKRAAAVRMSRDNIAAVVSELDAWMRGERVGRLSWDTLHRKFGFSRQTLCTKPEIVELYHSVKDRQKLGKGPKSAKTTDERVAALGAEIAHLRRTLDLYDERFARIAFWTHAKGIDLNALIQPLPTRNREEERRRSGSRRARNAG